MKMKTLFVWLFATLAITILQLVFAPPLTMGPLQVTLLFYVSGIISATLVAACYPKGPVV
jgi:hypothetical protein